MLYIGIIVSEYMDKQEKTPPALDGSNRYHYLLKPVNTDTAKLLNRAPSWARHDEDQIDQEQFRVQIEATLRGENQKKPDDLTNRADPKGSRCGRITVIKYSHSVKASKKDRCHYWLVKCDCGTYEIRKHSTLGRKDRQSDMCEQCKRNESLKRTAESEGRRSLIPLE